MAKEFIIAIELGSSKITGVAGKKNLDGSISILAVAQEDSSACIRKGVVYNHDRTVQCLTNIVNKLEHSLKSKIAGVYVCGGGQSIRSVKNVIVKDLEEGAIVRQDMIDELMDANRSMDYPEQEIIDAITQEYKVDNQLQLDPAGIQCKHLEGNFLNILWRKKFYYACNECFKSAGINIVEMYLAPLVLADSVLTESEKRSGCMLVDLGAETTTVSVYYKNILRHIAVIPLGSNNITKDIASLQIDEERTEEMKLEYGCAYTNNADIDNTLELAVGDGRKIESRRFIEIVESRMEEIIRNVWYQMPNEFSDKMLGGIILTGGGSNMRNIVEAFHTFTPIEKIRIAKFVNGVINANQPEITAHDGRMNTVLGLLERGNENCAGKDFNDSLFAPEDEGYTTTEKPKEPHQPGKGIIQTPEEKAAAEEAKRKKEEEEELKRQREAEEERKKERENSFWHRNKAKLKNFFSQIITEEE